LVFTRHETAYCRAARENTGVSFTTDYPDTWRIKTGFIRFYPGNPWLKNSPFGPFVCFVIEV